ncbi:hypothetical protein [Chelativorans sp. J32]|uniref:hypothetical protein n=1 Tax=Chelativorans sp. J32 TaxID=935840 RepID=UPI0004819912|nr:hypothetical protein [Chelativorans sp. J32]
MLGPLSRIILRYIAGALVMLGFLTADMGHMLADDPDLAALLQWALGIVAAALAEGGYWLAKRWGWRT